MPGFKLLHLKISLMIILMINNGLKEKNPSDVSRQETGMYITKTNVETCDWL